LYSDFRVLLLFGTGQPPLLSLTCVAGLVRTIPFLPEPSKAILQAQANLMRFRIKKPETTTKMVQERGQEVSR